MEKEEDPLEKQAVRFAIEDSKRSWEEEKRLRDLEDIAALERALEMSMQELESNVLKMSTDGFGGPEVKIVAISSDIAPVVIGKQQQRIQEIEMETGATIKVPKKEPGASQTFFSLSGSRAAIEKAESIIEEIASTVGSKKREQTRRKSTKKAKEEEESIFCFVDNSNIFIGAQVRADGSKDIKTRVKIEELVGVVENGRKIETRIVCGSKPPATSKVFFDHFFFPFSSLCLDMDSLERLQLYCETWFERSERRETS